MATDNCGVDCSLINSFATNGFSPCMEGLLPNLKSFAGAVNNLLCNSPCTFRVDPGTPSNLFVATIGYENFPAPCECAIVTVIEGCNIWLGANSDVPLCPLEPGGGSPDLAWWKVGKLDSEKWSLSPYAGFCGPDAGMPIHFDSNNQLRTYPDHTSNSFRSTSMISNFFTSDEVGFDVGSTFSSFAVINNPSSCRSFNAILEVGARVYIMDPDAISYATNSKAGFQMRVNGGSWIDVLMVGSNQNIFPRVDSSDIMISGFIPINLVPGASATIDLRFGWTIYACTLGSPILFAYENPSLSYFGVTQ